MPQLRFTAVAIRDPLPWAMLRQVVQIAESSGYGAIFVPEVGGREAYAQLCSMADVTQELLLGSGVVPIDSRSPEVLAMGAATLHDRSGGRAIVGIGSGAPRRGALAELRETVLFLRRVLVFDAAVPPGAEAAFEPLLDLRELPPPPIWIAALGDRTIRLAGEVADGVLLNWCTPERVAEAVALVAEGAASAGRDPGEVTIAVYLRACIEPNPGVGAAALQEAARGYVVQPGYARQFEAMGLDPRSVTAVVDAVCLPSDVDRARSRLQAYRDAGATVPVVYPVPALDPQSSIEGTLLGLASHPRIGG